MYLFFDTETTGLPRNWKAPISDLNNWPRLVQLAYIGFDDSGRQLLDQSVIIEPDGWTVDAEASRVHGITVDRARREGVPLIHALEDFRIQLNRATTLVAHNMAFDEKIVGAEFLRSFEVNYLDGKRRLCTMETATPLVAIQGYNGYKWPKLSELHEFLFGEDFEEAHDAGADIAATARCFWEMRRLGKI